MHRPLPSLPAHSALTKLPAPEDPMNGTVMWLSPSTTTDTLLVERTSPIDPSSGMLLPSENLAATTTSALSPSYVSGPSSTSTDTSRRSNGSSTLFPDVDCADIDKPRTTCASSPTTLIVWPSTVRSADPISVPSALVTLTAAAPADSPTTTSPLMIRATSLPLLLLSPTTDTWPS